MKYCEKCGNQLLDEAVICPKCGCPAGKSQAESAQDERSKSTAVGTICILAGIAIIVITILCAIAQYNRY